MGVVLPLNSPADCTLRVTPGVPNEQRSLLDGSSQLLACGITSHTADVVTRLRAINAEALDISQQLESLGEEDRKLETRAAPGRREPARAPRS